MGEYIEHSVHFQMCNNNLSVNHSCYYFFIITVVTDSHT